MKEYTRCTEDSIGCILYLSLESSVVLRSLVKSSVQTIESDILDHGKEARDAQANR